MTNIDEALGSVPSLTIQHVLRAGGEGSEELDYTVLSVAVMTLGLILVVELVRHKLDLSAIGRPFFKTVLEGVYGELATLGIVEWFIFLLHKYYEDLNVAQELVFADVHFTLFFTAIFNAFQSVLLAFFTTRISNRLWVQTEYQDFYHYVEIREEFDRLDRKFEKVFNKNLNEATESNQSHSLVPPAKKVSAINTRKLWGSNSSGKPFRLERIRETLLAFYRFLRHPVLYRKHHNLLVQVRFHELKYQFLRANELPLTLKISDYLMRSEIHVLKRLVHISTFAWLLLTGGINFMYFLMGMVVTATNGNNFAVGKAMTALFFLYMGLSVMFSFAIWSKTNWIFRQIMHARLLAQRNPQGGMHNAVSRSARTSISLDIDQGGFEQKKLFWGESPKYIIIMIQFLQFGFAVTLSILLIFWDDIDAESGSVAGEYFLLCLAICYGIFLYCMAHAIPRFTLCSNMGQLLNHQRLHETLATHRLEEAQRTREQRKAEEEVMEDSFEWGDESEELFTTPPLKAIKSISAAVVDLATGKEKPKVKDPIRSETDITPEMFEQLVQTETKELRGQLPQQARESLNRREKKERDIAARRARRKSVSDGVGALRASMVSSMSGFGSGLFPQEELVNTSSSSETLNTGSGRRGNRRKCISASADVQMMRNMIAGSTVSEARTASTVSRREMRRRRKAASAGVDVMREATITEGDEEGNFNDSIAADQFSRTSLRFSSRNIKRRNSADLNSSDSALRLIELTAASPMYSDLNPQLAPDTSPEYTKQSSDREEKDKNELFGSAQMNLQHPSKTEKGSVGKIYGAVHDEGSSTTRSQRKDSVLCEPVDVQNLLAVSDRNHKQAEVSPKDEQKSTDNLTDISNTPHDNSKGHAVTENFSSNEGLMFGTPENSLDFSGDRYTQTGALSRALPSNHKEPKRGGNLHTDRDLADWKLQSERSIDPKELMSAAALPSLSSKPGKALRKKEVAGDERTMIVNSDDSTSENGSDVDDVPEITEFDRKKRKTKPKPDPTLYDITRKYFRGKQYKITSAVFGTMICFFLVGMRIESLLLKTGVLEDLDNTWEIEPRRSFWLEFSFLLCFLIGDCIIMYLFSPSASAALVDRRAFTSAVVDVFITCACLCLLFIAESQRCCSDDTQFDDRKLGEEENKYEPNEYNKVVDIECCSVFGSRLYGGVGTIEPLTSIVALRLLRFWIAKKILNFVDKNSGQDRSSSEVETNETIRHPLDPLFEKRRGGSNRRPQSQGYQSGHDETGPGVRGEEVGTVVELWKLALGKYPDLVSTYGEFSGELLQAMLGIEVIENETAADPIAFGRSRHQLNLQSNDNGGKMPVLKEGSNEFLTSLHGPISTKSITDGHSRADKSISKLGSHVTNRGSYELNDQSRQRRRMSIMIGRQYKGTSPEVQSIILAGKVGKTEAATGQRGSIRGSVRKVGSGRHVFDESQGSIDSTNYDILRENAAALIGWNKSRDIAMAPDFETADDGDDNCDFFAPNARLLRSMRRCDRKLLPYLNQWTMVDVVMTKFEIVYFDATGVDNVDDQLPLNPKTKHIQDVKSALTATKGGKGLRLRDVAFGRRVVGRLELSSVESIHVARVLPHSLPEEASYEYDGHIFDEYWSKGRRNKDTAARVVRWSKVKEDRLKIETKHDTLYLRFYSDLDNCEHHIDRVMSESENHGPIYKNNAFQWCQTVARIVSSDRLHQEFPNIGADDENDELRGFLFVAEPDSAPTNQGRGLRSLLARQNSVGKKTSKGSELAKALGRRRFSSIAESGDSAIRGGALGFRRALSVGEEAEEHPPSELHARELKMPSRERIYSRNVSV